MGNLVLTSNPSDLPIQVQYSAGTILRAYKDGSCEVIKNRASVYPEGKILRSSTEINKLITDTLFPDSSKSTSTENSAQKIIFDFFEPYLQNLDSKHEATLLGICQEIRDHLIEEFEGY